MSDLCLSLREVLNMVNSLTDGWGKKHSCWTGWMGWVRAWPVVNWAGLVCKCVSRASVGMPVFWQRMVSNLRAQNGCLTNPEFSCVLFGSVVWCDKILGIKEACLHVQFNSDHYWAYSVECSWPFVEMKTHWLHHSFERLLSKQQLTHCDVLNISIDAFTSLLSFSVNMIW